MYCMLWSLCWLASQRVVSLVVNDLSHSVMLLAVKTTKSDWMPNNWCDNRLCCLLVQIISTFNAWEIFNILFTVYVVEVYTGNKAGAGTDAHVFVTLFGKRGQTPKTQLISKYVLIHLYYCCLHNDRAWITSQLGINFCKAFLFEYR